MRPYLYLNWNNRWDDFVRQGLELDADGALKLESLPALEGEMPTGIADLMPPTLAAGIAADADGTVFFSDPDSHLIYRMDGCDGVARIMPCLGGMGSEPTQFQSPRGLALHPLRPVLYIADSGNHRIQMFDTTSFQLLGILGESGSTAEQFDTPSGLAFDAQGALYVADATGARVLKLNPRGELVSEF